MYGCFLQMLPCSVNVDINSSCFVVLVFNIVLGGGLYIVVIQGLNYLVQKSCL